MGRNGHMDNTGNCFNVEKSQFVTNGNLGELQMSTAFPFRLSFKTPVWKCSSHDRVPLRNSAIFHLRLVNSSPAGHRVSCSPFELVVCTFRMYLIVLLEVSQSKIFNEVLHSTSDWSTMGSVQQET